MEVIKAPGQSFQGVPVTAPDAGFPAAPPVSTGFMTNQPAALQRPSSASRGKDVPPGTYAAEFIVIADETLQVSPGSESSAAIS